MTAAPPPAVDRYPCLGGLRAIAATAVVATHAGYWTASYTPDTAGRVLARGDVGVALFFVLSGFLLSRPLFSAAARGRPGPRTAAYLWRRALRILPVYWVAVVAALVLLPGNRDAGVPTWLRHLLLGQIYVRDEIAEGLTHTWSLCTEAAFYLLLPLLGAGLLRATGHGGFRPARLIAALAALAVLGEVWLAWSWADPWVVAALDVWLPSFAAWFGAGMAMAVLSVAAPDWAPVRRAHELGASVWTCWAGALALFWVACSPLTGPQDLVPPTSAEAVTKSVLYTGVAVLALWPLVFGDQLAGRTRRALAGRAARFLGDASYGLFLFHMPLLVGLYAALDRPPFTGSFVAVFLAVWVGGVVVAGTVHTLLERPLMRRFRDLVPERARTGAPLAGPAPADALGVPGG
ncbi:acyltransferase family protein [Geodermatophilus amargosae]|uniref:acyltransferase family protein n=1 Tax=Geodermatophilus amargosae TaxID=1296565 RepID=UPI0034DF2474